MLKVSKESKLKPEEAIKRAVAFFGPKGYGLEVKDEGNCCVTFEAAAAVCASAPPRVRRGAR